ncbi:MAG: hypothetical protein OXE96_16225 [Gemmatimonadetes bacterium]|nr:hypothetical protein [Gemmatimonadota bacterium]
MRTETTKEPGLWACRECGGTNLTFGADVKWNVAEQKMVLVNEADEKPYCQDCEDRVTWATWVPLERAEPSLCRDHYDDMYIVIDDDGEPASGYYMTLKGAQQVREDLGPGHLHYRIASVGYKALVPDDGSPVRIVDDPMEKHVGGVDA